MISTSYFYFWNELSLIAQQWAQYANIKLVFENDPDAEIRISCQPGGSWSRLGTDALSGSKNEPTINTVRITKN
jgi:hypothetical protein